MKKVYLWKNLLLFQFCASKIFLGCTILALCIFYCQCILLCSFFSFSMLSVARGISSNRFYCPSMHVCHLKFSFVLPSLRLLWDSFLMEFLMEFLRLFLMEFLMKFLTEFFIEFLMEFLIEFIIEFLREFLREFHS